VNRTIPIVSLLAVTTLAGCVAEPTRIATPAPPLVPDTNVYFYPAAGRTISAQQQDRDRYECNQWAVQQSGFDPSAPNLPPHQRMQIVAGGPPPGAAVAGGAVTGAFLGAATSRPWDAGRGTLIGALAGAAIGGIVESEQNNETHRLQARADAGYDHAQGAALEQKASQFRRAIGACLEARGYSVK
jgi:outer membrane lipoprotein SlyB